MADFQSGPDYFVPQPDAQPQSVDLRGQEAVRYVPTNRSAPTQQEKDLDQLARNFPEYLRPGDPAADAAKVRVALASPAKGVGTQPSQQPVSGPDWAAILGSMQGPPESMGSSTSSMHVRKGRPEDKAYLASLRSSEGAFIDEQKKLVESQRAIGEQHRGLLESWAADAKGMQEKYKGVADEALADYKSIGADLKRARDELRNMKVDPGRLWNSMPRTQQVMMAIGQMFGEMGQQASGGKITNEIGKWIKTATEQDIEIQREAIKMKMDDVKMSAQERNTLWRQWMAAEDQVRSATKAAADIELGKLAIATDDVKMKGELAKTIRGSNVAVSSAAHGEYVASQDTVTKGYSSTTGKGGKKAIAAGKNVGLGRVPVQMQVKTLESLAALRGLDQLKQFLIAKNPWATPYGLSGADTREFMQIQRPVVEAYIKGQSGATVPLKERAIFQNMFIKGWDPSGFIGERNRKEQLTKLDAFRRNALNQLRMGTKAYPELMDLASRSDPRYVQEAQNESLAPSASK